MTKPEWIIRLMQGMVGDYGNSLIEVECWYNGEAFKMKAHGEVSDLDLNWVNPSHDFRIVDTKGIPMQEINVCNITNT